MARVFNTSGPTLALSALLLPGVLLLSVGCAGPPEAPPPAGETPRDELPEDAARDAVADGQPVPMPGFSWVVDRRLAAMPQPGARRPLAEDLAFLQSQGIELLVSLTEEPTDPAALARRGIDRLHFPVRDFTAPSLEQLQRFVAAVESSSAAGRAVGVHCTAGLGRSGTFAAAYLVSRGLSATEAIAEVRRLRPGSVETSEQEERLGELAASLR